MRVHDHVGMILWRTEEWWCEICVVRWFVCFFTQMLLHIIMTIGCSIECSVVNTIAAIMKPTRTSSTASMLRSQHSKTKRTRSCRISCPESLTKTVTEETFQLEMSWLNFLAAQNILYCEQNSSSSAVVLFQIMRVQDVGMILCRTKEWWCETYVWLLVSLIDHWLFALIILLLMSMVVVWCITVACMMRNNATAIMPTAAMLRSQEHTTTKRTRSCRGIACPRITYKSSSFGDIPVGNVLIEFKSVPKHKFLWSTI